MEGVNNDYSWLNFPPSQPTMPRIHRVQFASTPRSNVGDHEENAQLGDIQQQRMDNVPRLPDDNSVQLQGDTNDPVIPERSETPVIHHQGASGVSENNTAELLERNIESQNVLVDMIKTLHRRIDALERNVLETRPEPRNQAFLGPRNEGPPSFVTHPQGRTNPTVLQQGPLFVNNPTDAENVMRFPAPNLTGTVLPPRAPQAYSTAFGDPTYTVYNPIGASSGRFAGPAPGISFGGLGMSSGWPGGNTPTVVTGPPPSGFQQIPRPHGIGPLHHTVTVGMAPSTINDGQTSRNGLFPRPTFRGENDERHPIEFLTELDRFCYHQGLAEFEKLPVALSCLTGEAKVWARGFEYLFQDYAAFVHHFKENFWGQTAQRQVSEEIARGNYVPRNGSRMAEYFLGIVAKARYLTPPPTERELIQFLSRHFPRNVQHLLGSCMDIGSGYNILQAEDRFINGSLRYNNGNARDGMNPPSWRSREGIPVRNSRGTPNANVGGITGTNNVRMAVVEEDESCEGIDPAVLTVFVGREQLLELEEESMPENTGKIKRSSYITVELAGLQVDALVDSGCELSCISSDLYDRLKKAKISMPELPMKAISLRGAFGKKSKNVNLQVLLEIRIGQRSFDVPFVVVRELINSMILGEDFQDQYAVWIHQDEKKIRLLHEDTEMWVDFSVEGKTSRCIENVLLCESMVNFETEEDKKPEGNDHRPNPLLLTEYEEQTWRELQKEFEDIFSDQQPGFTTEYYHEILVTNEAPFNQKQYPIPYSRISKVDEKLRLMEEWGVISRSPTPYVNPLVTTIKRNGDVRVCLDARRLNKVLVKDHEKPANIQEILQKFNGSRYFSAIGGNQ